MNSLAVPIQELFESEQSPSKIGNLLKGCASRSGVYKVLKHVKETGSALPKVKSTPRRKVRTPKLIKITREIRRNPRSMRKLASASSVSYETIQTVLKNDLNLSPQDHQDSATVSSHKDQETAKSKASSGESKGWHVTSDLVDS